MSSINSGSQGFDSVEYDRISQSMSKIKADVDKIADLPFIDDKIEVMRSSYLLLNNVIRELEKPKLKEMRLKEIPVIDQTLEKLETLGKSILQHQTEWNKTAKSSDSKLLRDIEAQANLKPSERFTPKIQILEKDIREMESMRDKVNKMKES